MKELKKSVKVIIIVSVIAVCVLALVLGLVFGLKDINKGGSNTPPPPSGPNTPVDPDNPDNPQNPDEPKATFTIYIDYNLPEGYEKAGEGLKTQDVGQKASTYELSKLLEGLNLSNYLEGWYYADGDSKITNGIVGPVDTNEVRVRAEWNIERIQKYYYSDGLGFDTISGREVAMVTEYKGTSPYVFLPEVFINKNNNAEYAFAGISQGAFKDNKTIKELIVPETVESYRLEGDVFLNSSIETFDFEKVNFLGQSAFKDSAIESVTFENSDLSNIPESAFEGCVNLSSVKLSSRVNIISSNAFGRCTALDDLSFLSTMSGSANIMDFAFNGCTGLSEVVVPQNISLLGEKVFENCINLQKITIYNQNCYIDREGRFTTKFGDLHLTLKEIVFGNGVERIPDYYLSGYSNLQKVVIDPDSVTSIGSNAFSDCVKLEDINLKDLVNLSEFYSSSVSNTPWFNNSNDIIIINNSLALVPGGHMGETEIDLSAENFESIAASVFKNFTNLQTLKLPVSVQTINSNAFSGCSNLETVKFMSSEGVEGDSALVTIGQEAFNGCVNLSDFNFTKLKHLENIGTNAFYNCKSLTNFDLSQTALISIGDSAFQIEGAFIEAIDEVSLPNTITRLGTNVFLKLGVKSYKLNSTSSYISVQDGVLYIQTTSGKALYQYPIASDAVIFKVPADVDEILSGSFTGADEQNLKAIYVASRGSDNHLKINSGHGFNAAILTEDENIDVSFFDKYITYLKTTLESGDYSLAEDELTVNESGKGKLDELSFDGAGYYVFISDSSGTKKLFLITKNLEGDGYEATLLFDNYQE